VIVRIAATLSVVLGATLFVLYLHLVGKGPWTDAASRNLRVMKDRTSAPAALAAFPFDSMAALPAGLSLDRYRPIEERGVVLEGYVQLMARAPDGDYHLEVAPSADGPDASLVPYVTGEITPAWSRRSKAWRFEPLVAAFRPLWGGGAKWAQGPRRCRIGGWLLYDYPFEGETPRPGHPPRLTRWEIHPVTHIEVWDEKALAFVEVQP
jgi:hypothetical protein